MGQLNCSFVPLVFAELYKLLVNEERYADTLEDQLASIYLTLEWLAEAADAYDQKWMSELDYLTTDCIADYALSEQHSQFATWLLSGLHASASCGELSTALHSAVLTRALSEIDGLQAPLPAALSPVIIGWTLGSVIGTRGSDLPVAPAVLPSDENARVAFEGLAEHVLALQAIEQPWSEMMQTAMYWRGYGIAEALLPEEGTGREALDRLAAESRSSMPESDRVLMQRHLATFGDRRNALSHIATDHNGFRFVDVVNDVREGNDLDLTMRIMTQFVFQEVAREVRDRRPSVVRPSAWETMVHEIQVWS